MKIDSICSFGSMNAGWEVPREVLSANNKSQKCWKMAGIRKIEVNLAQSIGLSAIFGGVVNKAFTLHTLWFFVERDFSRT